MRHGLFLLALLVALSSAQAQMPPAAGACMGCHGPGGHSQGDIPSLAGLDEAEFTQAMGAFKAGEGTIMNRIAPAYGDAAIKAMARYFAGLEAAQ